MAVDQAPAPIHQQLRDLRRIVADRDTPPKVARRAQLILDEVDARRRGRARPSSARKWSDRFVERGVVGLRDAARQGRPPRAREAERAAVLTAPLVAATPAWTSRSIATQVGVSQSAVSRAWQAAFSTAVPSLGSWLPRGELTLTACFAASAGSVLAFTVDPGSTPPVNPGSPMRHPSRPALQTILAADIFWASAEEQPPPHLAAKRFLTDLGRHQRASGPLHVIATDGPVANALAKHTLDGHLLVIGREHWQGLLPELLSRLGGGPGASGLAAAQRQAMAAAHLGEHALTWFAEKPERPSGRRPSPAAGPRHVPASGRVLTDAVVATLERELISGRLRGGDRVRESSLARAVHASPAQVRHTLRTLAATGLVEMRDDRRVVVPRPSSEDVAETYTARRALGALIVRRAAEAGSPDLVPALDVALRDLLMVAEGGDAWATGDADLRFQDVLAARCGLRRVPAMFLDLSGQVRISVATLGLTYAYSVPAMVRDDTTLFERITERDRLGALQAWDTKMRDALAYLLGRLHHPPARREQQ